MIQDRFSRKLLSRWDQLQLRCSGLGLRWRRMNFKAEGGERPQSPPGDAKGVTFCIRSLVGTSKDEGSFGNPL